MEEFSVNTARDFAHKKGCDMVVLHFGALCCILQLWGVHCKIFTFNFTKNKIKWRSMDILSFL